MAKKKQKIEDVIEIDDDDEIFNNQILNWKK